MTSAEKKIPGESQRRLGSFVWLLIALLFFSLQLLLPVERGLTIVRLFGAPIYLPMITNFVGGVLLFFFYPKRTFLALSKPWVVLNLFFAIFCFLSSVLSTSWEISLFYSYMWISN